MSRGFLSSITVTAIRFFKLWYCFIKYSCFFLTFVLFPLLLPLLLLQDLTYLTLFSTPPSAEAKSLGHFADTHTHKC